MGGIVAQTDYDSPDRRLERRSVDQVFETRDRLQAGTHHGAHTLPGCQLGLPDLQLDLRYSTLAHPRTIRSRRRCPNSPERMVCCAGIMIQQLATLHWTCSEGDYRTKVESLVGR